MAHIHGGFGDVDVYSELCCMKSLHFAMKIFMEMHPMPPAAPADAGEMHFFKFLDWNRARSRGGAVHYAWLAWRDQTRHL